MFSWLSGSGRKSTGEDSLLGQTPSVSSDVRGRLNFSALGSPRPALSSWGHGGGGGGGGGGESNVVGSYTTNRTRLGEYHRSRQNPAVLDQFISSQTPHSLYKSSPAVSSNSDRFNLFSSPAGTTTGFSTLPRRSQTPFRMSPFQSRSGVGSTNTSPFSSGLVNRALRSGSTASQLPGVSSVMVHLPTPSSSSSSSSSLPLSTDPVTRGPAEQSSGETKLDPCNRDVVISALKQKRKRWVCPTTGDDVIGNEESQPAAKRSRHTTEKPRSSSLSPSSLFIRPSLSSRKRGHTSSVGLSTSTLSQSLKKPRVFQPPTIVSPWKRLTLKSSALGQGDGDKKEEGEVTKVIDHVTMPETGQPREHPLASNPTMGQTNSGRILKLSVPDMEYESDNESVRGGGGVLGGALKGDGVEESSVDSGRGSRGSTPPVQEEEEEESREDERVRRNRVELQRLQKSLTTVFPPLHKSTSRRKLPVLCATGSVPLQPPSLVSSRGVTQEDWRKEREMARARLRCFLATDNEPPTKPPTPPPPAEKAPTVSAPTTTPSSSSSSSSISTSVTSSAVVVSLAAKPITTTTPTVTTPALSSFKMAAPKSVTFQLPNIATSTQSLSSLSTVSQQLSGSSSGLGQEVGVNLASISTLPAPQLPGNEQQQQQMAQKKEEKQHHTSTLTSTQSLTFQSSLSQAPPTVTPTTTSSLVAPPPRPQQINTTLTSATPNTSSHPPPSTASFPLPSSTHLQQQHQQSAIFQTPKPSPSTTGALPLPSMSSAGALVGGLTSVPSMVSSGSGGLNFGFGKQTIFSTSTASTQNSNTVSNTSTGGLQFQAMAPPPPPAAAPPSSSSSVATHSSQSALSGSIFASSSSSSSSVTAPVFNFSGRSGNFNFSSGASSSQQTQTQQQQKPASVIFGSTAAPQNQNPVGGFNFGATPNLPLNSAPVSTASATSFAPPTFNFLATSSANSAAGKPQQVPGGMTQQTSLKPPALPSNNQPSFNFGGGVASAATSQTQQSSMATGNMFNFAGTSQLQNLGTPQSGLLFGGGGGGGVASNPSTNTKPAFNFSAAASQTGTNPGSSNGFNFGVSSSTRSGGSSSSGGFNFPTASTQPPGGGLNFGTGGGGSNQPMFGQVTSQTSTSSISFNPSLPAVPPQTQTPQPPQFSFTPQPTTGGFNFSGTPAGLNFGSPGAAGGTLFSAGTPAAGETPRPVATARRRRGRRK